MTEEPVTIALSQDTPFVVSATVSGETTANIGGTYYVGATTCTVAINFNKAMVTTASPDTMVVQFKPPAGSFTDILRFDYTSATWKGTTVITPAMDDGEVVIRVQDAYDNDGTVRFIDPNPDQTDYDLADEFKPFGLCIIFSAKRKRAMIFLLTTF